MEEVKGHGNVSLEAESRIEFGDQVGKASKGLKLVLEALPCERVKCGGDFVTCLLPKPTFQPLASDAPKFRFML